jgi:acetolactate synthase-1/2/3 large subunit
MRTIADFVMQTLRLTGTDVVFGYPGQSNLGLLHAARRAGIRYVQTADERAAGFAAIGYALSTQKVGIVCVSKGPAATNLLTPLLSAMKDGVPLVVVTGNVAAPCRGHNGFQEFDVCNAFTHAGAVKLARYCESPEAIAHALIPVLESAFTLPFGPALIDIPYDLLADACTVDPAAIATRCRAAARDPKLPAKAIDAAVTRLTAAERPVVIVGCGARRDYEAVRAFADAYGSPVVHTMGGTGVIPTDHPLYGGLLRHNGSPTAARLVDQADVILALGTGLDERATGERTRFARRAIKIQVDVSAEVLRNQFVDIPVNAPIRAFLDAVGGRMPLRSSYDRWTEELVRPDATRTDACHSTDPISAREVIRFASEALEHAIVVKDSGSHKYWMTNLAPCADPSQSIASCHFGAMGFALPAAIGASIGNPHRTVIAVCGDGGLLMSLSDLLTAVRESCRNLKILVFNNAGLGSTRDFERRAHAGAACISDFGEPLSFACYARAMGMESDSIAERTDLHRLGPMLLAPGLALLDCLIDPTERLTPSVPYLGPLARLADEDPEYVTT